MNRTAMILGILLGISAIAGMSAGLNPLNGNDWAFDSDNDGLTNLDEYLAGSDPNNWDTDGDSLPDGWEVDNSLDPKDPSDAQMDNDYFGGEEYASYSQVDPPYDNFAEYFRLAGIDVDTGDNIYIPTDPNNPDTDGDKILDPDDPTPWEHSPGGGGGGGGGGSKPTPGPGPAPPGPSPNPTPGPSEPGPINPDDLDGDGLVNEYEFMIGTDYLNPDTDGDGLIDSWEVLRGVDPNDWDTDNDMLIDLLETAEDGSTDGHLEDTDNDGTSGGPGNPVPPVPNPNPGPPIPPPPDSDHDGLDDEYEMSIGTDYLNPDTDGDGLLDPLELSLNLDPNDWDTDNDLLIDGVELGEGYSTDGHLEDTDNDGIA